MKLAELLHLKVDTFTLNLKPTIFTIFLCLCLFIDPLPDVWERLSDMGIFTSVRYPFLCLPVTTYSSYEVVLCHLYSKPCKYMYLEVRLNCNHREL